MCKQETRRSDHVPSFPTQPFRLFPLIISSEGNASYQVLIESFSPLSPRCAKILSLPVLKVMEAITVAKFCFDVRSDCDWCVCKGRRGLEFSPPWLSLCSLNTLVGWHSPPFSASACFSFVSGDTGRASVAKRLCDSAERSGK